MPQFPRNCNFSESLIQKVEIDSHIIIILFSLFIYFSCKWNIVCEWSWMRVTADAVFMLGDLIGSTVFGAMSDR